MTYVPDNEDIRRQGEEQAESEYIVEHQIAQMNRRKKKHANDLELVEHSFIEREDEDEYII